MSTNKLLKCNFFKALGKADIHISEKISYYQNTAPPNNKMKYHLNKILMVLITVLFFSNLSFSQTKLSLQAGMAFPSSDFSNVAGTGYGIEGTILFPQTEFLSFCGIIGYYTWGPYIPWYLGPSDNYSSFLVMIGIRYAFSNKRIHPYMEMDVGMNSLSFSRTYNYTYTSSTTQVTQGRFGAFPGFGVLFNVHEGLKIDVNIKYCLTSSQKYLGYSFSTSFFSLNAGLQFEM